MRYIMAISNEAIVSLILAILSCVVHLRVHEVKAGAGGIPTCTFMDYGALGFGLAAIIAGFITMYVGMRGNDLPSTLLGGLSLFVGILRLGYGAGFAMGPCN